MRRRGIEGPTKYWCCIYLDQETIAHVFLRSPLANRTWSYFASCTGILLEGLKLKETILTWWNEEVKGRIKPYFQSLPSMISREIQKKGIA